MHNPEIRLHEGDALAVLRAIPDATYTFVVSDPPYGLSTPPDPLEVMRQWLADGDFVKKSRGKATAARGFMGAEWDAFVPGPVLWREVGRTCKPGAMLLCFAATRTMDWMMLSLRCAGFEIIDVIAWMTAQGMAKAGTIDKKIDAKRDDREQVLTCTRWIRERCEALGLKSSDLDRAAGTNGMGGHWTTAASQPYVPTHEQWAKLEPMLGPMPPEIEAQRLIIDAREKGPGWAQREVLSVRDMGESSIFGRGMATRTDSLPSDASAAWAGWSTQLAPGYEPIIVARWPCEGTATANVLKHGCGAMNIDACRISAMPRDEPTRWSSPRNMGYGKGMDTGPCEAVTTQSGRWPKNVMLDRSAAAVLDALVPHSRDGVAVKSNTPVGKVTGFVFQRGNTGIDAGYGGAGGASRFFWVGPLATDDDTAAPFRYVPKVRTAERHAGLPDDVKCGHLTMKPGPLMEWLCRLVGHPNGRGLDPFAGSGSTLRAARKLGLSFDGIERDPNFAEIARWRAGLLEENPDYDPTGGEGYW